jgi:hypothetical protein
LIISRWGAEQVHPKAPNGIALGRAGVGRLTISSNYFFNHGRKFIGGFYGDAQSRGKTSGSTNESSADF